MTAQELLMALWAEFPKPSLLLAVLILIGGIMLLFAGRQLLSILLLALGAALGYALGSWLGVQLDSNLPVWAPGLVGAVVLGGILVMAQRAIVPACLALTLAIVGPVAFAISAPTSEATLVATQDAQVIIAPTESNDVNALPTASLEQLAPGQEEATASPTPLSVILGTINTWWAERSPGSRGGIMITVLVGLIVGLLVGIALPRATATAITAAFGAAIALASLSWLFMILRGLSIAPAPENWQNTFALWLIVTVAGCLLQWALSPNSKSSQPQEVTANTRRRATRKRISSGDTATTA